ncbi:MAG: hypothetical protein ACKPKO_38230, partial [Candidatus Fonsibacter sp.]
MKKQGTQEIIIDSRNQEYCKGRQRPHKSGRRETPSFIGTPLEDNAGGDHWTRARTKSHKKTAIGNKMGRALEQTGTRDKPSFIH